MDVITYPYPNLIECLYSKIGPRWLHRILGQSLGQAPVALHRRYKHYSDVIISTMVSQITSLTIVYSTVYSGADQRKYQSSASVAFVRGINRWMTAQRASNAENVSIWCRPHAAHHVFASWCSVRCVSNHDRLETASTFQNMVGNPMCETAFYEHKIQFNASYVRKNH